MMDDMVEDHEFAGAPDWVPDEDVEVRRLGDRAVLVPKAARRLDGEALHAFGQVQQVARAYVELDAWRSEAVEAARDAGVSWHLIGWCLGVTGDAARRRFGGDGS